MARVTKRWGKEKKRGGVVRSFTFPQSRLLHKWEEEKFNFVAATCLT